MPKILGGHWDGVVQGGEQWELHINGESIIVAVIIYTYIELLTRA